MFANTVTLTAESSSIISLAEAKEHLRVDGSDDDVLIISLIESASEHVRNIIRGPITQATYRTDYDKFPCEFHLPRVPVQSVTSIQYYDTDNVLQTLASTEYRASDDRIEPVTSWPSTKDRFGAVMVTYVAGNSLAPKPISSAINLLVGHFYENREASLIGTSSSYLVESVDSLLEPYRRYEF